MITLTAAAVVGLVWIQAPAALLLGPLLVGLLFALCGTRLKPSRLAKSCAQGVIGSAVAIVLASAVGPELMRQGGLFLAIGVATLTLAMGLAWTFTRFGWLSGATAVWGMAPGSATAMITLADEAGADPRAVALMQYTRILVVAFSTLTVAHWMSHMVIGQAARGWLPALEPWPVAAMLALAASGVILGGWTRIGTLPLLVPILVGTALGAAGVEFATVPLVTAMAYAVIGWSIGLSFSRASLLANLRTLPAIIAGVAILVLACAGVGMILSRAFGIDPLSAYLATSPGGIDAMLIIAASVHVNLPFILAAQLVRFLMVLALGRPLGRFIARRERVRLGGPRKSPVIAPVGAPE